MSNRTLITNGNVAPGDGEKILRDCCVVIEDGIILDIVRQPFIPYDPAENMIDAKGGLIIPGIINHHSHGGALGPFNVFGEKSLSLERVIYNLNRHLLNGTTTVVNACGWPTMGEIEITNKHHPVNVRATTIHTHTHLKHAKFVDGQGIRDWHQDMTVSEMIRRGAVAIGEVGAPCAAYGTPQIVRELKRVLTIMQVQQLKEAVLGKGIDHNAYDEGQTGEVIREIGLDGILKPEQVKALMERHVLEPYEMTKACVKELADAAIEHEVPLLFHSTMDTRDLLFGLAPKLGNRLIALHSNYTYTPDEAVECAKELKRHGAWIDIFTGDAYGTQMFQKSPEVTLALFKEGLVDLVATDYIAGYWDPIPLVFEKAIEAGLITLPKAIRKMSRDVVEAIPLLGQDRGMIAPGKIADIVIVDAKRISRVSTVIIGGRTVVAGGAIVH